MKAKWLGRYLLTALLVDALVRECPAAGMNYSGQSSIQAQRQSAAIVVALIVLAVGGFVLWKLAQLCRHVLPNPPAPPPSTNAVPASLEYLASGTGNITKPFVVIPCVCIPASDISCISQQTPDFQDPSGGYYDHMFQVTINSSPDLASWTAEGTATAWFNANYLLVAQYDQNGVQVSLTLYQSNWHDLSSNILLNFTEKEQGQLFYKLQ